MLALLPRTACSVIHCMHDWKWAALSSSSSSNTEFGCPLAQPGMQGVSKSVALVRNRRLTQSTRSGSPRSFRRKLWCIVWDAAERSRHISIGANSPCQLPFWRSPDALCAEELQRLYNYPTEVDSPNVLHFVYCSAVRLTYFCCNVTNKLTWIYRPKKAGRVPCDPSWVSGTITAALGVIEIVHMAINGVKGIVTPSDANSHFYLYFFLCVQAVGISCISY